jgi:hypothetical protein
LKKKEKSFADAQKMAHIGNWDWDIITSASIPKYAHKPEFLNASIDQ